MLLKKWLCDHNQYNYNISFQHRVHSNWLQLSINKLQMHILSFAIMFCKALSLKQIIQ